MQRHGRSENAFRNTGLEILRHETVGEKPAAGPHALGEMHGAMTELDRQDRFDDRHGVTSFAFNR
jgi:hypothetical protein